MSQFKTSDYSAKYEDIVIDNISFILRDIESIDYDKKYLQLLPQLSIFTEFNMYKPFDNFITSLSPTHRIFVLEDLTTRQIVATTTLLIEPKIIHNFGKVGHIEDVIVDNVYRGKGLGKILVQKAMYAAKTEGCYKCILNCSPKNEAFYKKCGFEHGGGTIEMSRYF